MQKLPFFSMAAFFTLWEVGSVLAERPPLIDQVKRTAGEQTEFSVPFERYQSDLRDLPIGVFDSGIGGLTVLEEILKLDLHHNDSGAPGADGIPDFQGEQFVYLGDQANMPYGNYSSANKTDFLRELILRDALFLLGTQYWASPAPSVSKRSHDKLPVKAIVIACNTATAYGLDDIRDALKQWDIAIPVIGVVEAGGRGVIDLVRKDPTKSAAAVLATVGTCDSRAYPKTIARLAGEQGLRVPFVWQQGSVGLAGAIEGNVSFVANVDSNRPDANSNKVYLGPTTAHPKAPLKPELYDVYGFDPQGTMGGPDRPETWRITSVENYIRYDVTTLVDAYRVAGETKPLETIVLGCTHFPLATSSIHAAFMRLREYRDPKGNQPYHDLIAESLQFVNPGEYTAKELFRTLFLQQLNVTKDKRRSPQSTSSGEDAGSRSDTQFYISVPSPNAEANRLEADGGFTAAYKYGRSVGDYRGDDVRIVPLASDPRAAEAVAVWRAKLPHVAHRLDRIPSGTAQAVR